jgi:4-hydroxy-tetrahydrodipicolinate synthase
MLGTSTHSRMNNTMNHHHQFQGIYSAIPTPFKGENQSQIDYEALDTMLSNQLQAGLAGFVAYGTTGESVCLSTQEKQDLLAYCIQFCKDYAKKHNRPKAQVIAGVGTNCTADSIEYAKQAQALGADGALVVTPYYNKPSQQGLYLHFKAIAQAVPTLPMILYTVPGRTGIQLSIECIERLMSIENIVAVKDATGDLVYGADLIRRCGHRLSILSGDDPTLLSHLSLGGHGSISVLSNLSPFAVQKLYVQMKNQDYSNAQAQFFNLLPIARQLFIEANPIPIKQALAWKFEKIWSADLRLPLCRMSENHLQIFQQSYQQWAALDLEDVCVKK